MVQGLSFYTGVIVKGFTHGVGFPICGGGRYDELIGGFGKDIPATGIAIGIERVISALGDAKNTIPLPRVDVIVCYENNRDVAYKVAEGMRKTGLVVQMEQNYEGIYEFAKGRGVGGIVNIIDSEKIKIINLLDGDVKTTSISELLGV